MKKLYFLLAVICFTANITRINAQNSAIKKEINALTAEKDALKAEKSHLVPLRNTIYRTHISDPYIDFDPAVGSIRLLPFDSLREKAEVRKEIFKARASYYARLSPDWGRTILWKGAPYTDTLYRIKRKNGEDLLLAYKTIEIKQGTGIELLPDPHSTSGHQDLIRIARAEKTPDGRIRILETWDRPDKVRFNDHDLFLQFFYYFEKNYGTGITYPGYTVRMIPNGPDLRDVPAAGFIPLGLDLQDSAVNVSIAKICKHAKSKQYNYAALETGFDSLRQVYAGYTRRIKDIDARLSTIDSLLWTHEQAYAQSTHAYNQSQTELRKQQARQAEASRQAENQKRQEQKFTLLVQKYGQTTAQRIIKHDVWIGMPEQLIIEQYPFSSLYYQSGTMKLYVIRPTLLSYTYACVRNGKVTELSTLPLRP